MESSGLDGSGTLSKSKTKGVGGRFQGKHIGTAYSTAWEFHVGDANKCSVPREMVLMEAQRWLGLEAVA
jgi:hypothetical protein